MHALYLLSVFVHVLSAIVWIGGMCFLVLVVVPIVRAGDRQQAGAFLRQSGVRFRGIGWTCFALIALTGAYNLHVRGVQLHDFADASWRAAPFGSAVVWKLSVFCLVVAASAVHDFALGPRASRAIEQAPRAPEAERLRRYASWLGRTNLVLALVLLALGIFIVRGWPF